MEQLYKEIPVSELSPNPWNPRKRFEGPEFDELTASIREKGIVQPILARPVDDGYQVVAGERRYRAAVRIASDNGGPEACRVPAVVRELSDDEAFELTMIENLQRQDLTELEEARSFKEYLDRKGMEALPELADRTGIHPRYIRRRVAVLGLPKTALNAWEKGKLKYGHLEVLSRLKNRKEINRYVGEIIDWNGRMSVRELARRIDMESPLLAWAKFDIKEAGCLTCAQNSDVQKEMFGDPEKKKTKCLDPACFKLRQHNHLAGTWKRTGYYRKYHTTGFRFHGDISISEYHNFEWHGSPGDDCRYCPRFVTIIDLDGETIAGQACLGSNECFLETTAAAKRKERAATSESGDAESGKADPGPRVAWHGEFFRERFYEEVLPERMKKMTVLEDVHLQMLALLDANGDLAEWFARRQGLGEENEWGDFNYSLVDDLAPAVFGMDLETTVAEYRAMVIEAVMQPQFGARLRRVTADYLGIDLKREWRLNKEYLNKKTIKEMLALGEDLGIFKDRKARAFVHEVLGKKRKAWKSCKKGELIRVFLESGVDLAGKVPAEILAE